MKEKLPYQSEWTFPLIDQYHREIARVAESFKLDCYSQQLEIITSEQMMDAYSSVGMPVNYHHWSFGKEFFATERKYRRGQMGLAYEIVINSDPCISYLMEENTLMMQALVIAHAAYGHNSFFKGNKLFRDWTSADAIIDYLVYARNYIDECREKHGFEAVETFIDSCHALQNLGVDRYKRPSRISITEEKARRHERQVHLQEQVNELWRKTVPGYGIEKPVKEKKQQRFPGERQENLLYFFEKHAPFLETWQREIIRIVRKISQYFYPQRQTQVMNEGWATFWHYTILQTLCAEGLLHDGFMLEFLASHTSVVAQPSHKSRRYSGINVYALGFAMWTDIRRICEHPTDEDREWFPEIAGSDWQQTFDDAMRNYRDESFVQQFLSPKVMRDFHLFSVFDDADNEDLYVSAIHNAEGYREVRSALADSYNLSNRDPNIQVDFVDIRNDRELTLVYTPHKGRELDKDTAIETLKHAACLWTCPVVLEAEDADTGDRTLLGRAYPESGSSEEE
jgi:spore cortex formation protein SpoVR/YcgB (stage V sporulation)